MECIYISRLATSVLSGTSSWKQTACGLWRCSIAFRISWTSTLSWSSCLEVTAWRQKAALLPSEGFQSLNYKCNQGLGFVDLFVWLVFYLCCWGGVFASRWYDDTLDEKRHANRRRDAVLYSWDCARHWFYSSTGLYPSRYQTRQPSSGQQGMHQQLARVVGVLVVGVLLLL